jgi:mRNA interferase MazF
LIIYKDRIGKKDGFVLLDQIRTVDKTRPVKKLRSVDKSTSKEISAILVEMFKM